MTSVEGQPHHTPRGSRTRLSGLPTGHRARPHTTDRVWMPCRHSIGLRAVSPHRQASQLSPRPLGFLLSKPRHSRHVHAPVENMPQVPWNRPSRKQCGCRCHSCRMTVTATQLFFVRCRGERPVFLGGSNHSPKTSSLLSFMLPCSCRPGHLIVPTAKVSHARLAASVFMQHL